MEKENPNYIVKAFENDDVFIFQEDFDNKINYYFKASDVAKILDLTNIRATIQNYEEDEKVVKKAYDLRGCEQDTTFLTSRGIYRLLYNSKKPLAKKFRKWVGDILDDIIFNQSKKLKEQLDNNQKLLEEKDKILKEKDNIIEDLENRPETNGFFNKQKGYVYLVHDTDKRGHFKIGMTSDINKRICGLNGGSSTYSLIMTKYWETPDKLSAEKICHMILDPLKIKTRCEWFYVKNDNELSYVIDTINKCLEFVNKYQYKDVYDFNEKIKDIDTSIINEICLQNNQNPIISKNKQNAQNLKARTGLYKGVHFNIEKKKWDSCLKYNAVSNFLGRYETEELAGIAYNDFALYMNKINKDCNYIINEIENYIPNPRNVPEDNKLYNDSLKTSKYIGLSYVEKRKKYQVCIGYNNKDYFLGQFKKEEDGAKIYNKQALYFNNHFNTKYELNTIENYETVEENIIEKIKEGTKLKIENQSSKYIGVSYSKQAKKWRCVIINDKKQYHLGAFVNQIDAAKKYNEKAIEFNKKLEFENKKRRYKLNVFE